MTRETLIPTNIRQTWRAGAEAEARLRNSGLSREHREMRDWLVAVARGGAEPKRTVARFVRVFTADWPLRERLRLAWSIIR